MDSGVSDSLSGVFPNKVYATLEIRACRRNYQCTPAGKINLSDSRVHGNRTLYAEARSSHYKLYLYTCWFRVLLPRGDVEGGNSEAWLIYIQLTIVQCCSNFCCIVTFLLYIEMLADSPLMLQDSSEDASLR